MLQRPLSPRPQRGAPARALACALAAALHALPAAAQADAPLPVTAHTVKAPAWGDALFHFYQDQHFTALTSLMVSQHFQRVSPHDDEAEVLRGGMLLSWGLHEQAGEVFERLIDGNSTPAVRSRAWFWLAKVRFSRGLVAEAGDALTRISTPLPPELEEARTLLQAQVLLALDDPLAAATVLQPLASAPPRLAEAKVLMKALKASTGGTAREVVAELPWWQRVGQWFIKPFQASDQLAVVDADAGRFARFNLGVALIRSGSTEAGERWLDELGQQAAANEEQRKLRDQANLALGFSALQRNEPVRAREWLERVRLNGAVSNKALLGFGWAALQMQQPRHALVPWTELAGRNSQDAAVLEARLALPHALAELGADGQALVRYEQALTDFQTEQASLNQALATLRGGAWLNELLALNPETSLSWFTQTDTLPELPHAAQLAPVLASHDFQEGFKTLRDLQFLRANLADWQERLGTWQDMIDHRRAVFAGRAPGIRTQGLQIDLTAPAQRLAALQAANDQARADADGLAYADARQQALLKRVAQARQRLAELPGQLASALAAANDAPAELPAQAAERLRLAAGVLRWELAQAFPERLWTSTRALARAGTELDEATARKAALAQAQIDETARLNGFDGRLQGLAERIKTLQAPIAAATRAQAQALQALATASLIDQQERLVHYSTQARFAMAQLHDRARQPQEAPRGAPR